MAVWHVDNFTGWGLIATQQNREDNITAMLQGAWTASDRGTNNDYLFVTSDPQDANQRVLSVQAGNTSYIRKTHPDGPQTQLTARARTYIPSLILTTGQRILSFLTASNTVLAHLWVDFIGRVNVTTNGVTYTTPAPKVTAGGWYVTELLMDQTNFTVQIEGVTVLGPQAHGLTAPELTQYELRSNGVGIFYIKDLVLGDGTGSYNNSFIGTKLIADFDITADATLNWTASTGSTGYNLLQKSAPDDATYIFAGATPIPSPYKGVLDVLPADATSVAAVFTRVRALKSDGGDGSLQVGIISDPSGTPATALGVNRPITTSATYWQDVFEEDPSTGVAWTVPSVNDIHLQLNRTT